MKRKVLIVVGTRPNFIKVTLFKRFQHLYNDLEFKIVHTGQHFDSKMSSVFFDQFGLKPDFFLNSSGENATIQVGAIITHLSKLISDTYKPDLMMVVGDVNSTLAASIVANKMNIQLAHLESGLRSNDRLMPEEINRIVTDELSDFYFVSEEDGYTNLQNENRAGRAFLVGNTMIDTLCWFQEEIEASTIIEALKVKSDKYILVTAHRPSNVDNIEKLKELVSFLQDLLQQNVVVFPIHPRTRNMLVEGNLMEALEHKNLIITEAMNYFDFQKLIKESQYIVTDSGGIQEEATYYKKICFTIRENTERPSTIKSGSNHLISMDFKQIMKILENDDSGKNISIPKYWDGDATKRIIQIIDSEILPLN